MDRTVAFLLLAGMTLLLIPLGFSLLFILIMRNRPAPQAPADGAPPPKVWDAADRAAEWGQPLDEWRIARLERRIDLILTHLGVEDRYDPREAARTLLRSGKRIQAIRMYRAETGAGLNDATHEIEALERELKQAGSSPGATA